MTDLLSDSEIDERLAGGDWRRKGDEIEREWTFDDFKAAMAFANRSQTPRRPTTIRTSWSTAGTRCVSRSPTIRRVG